MIKKPIKKEEKKDTKISSKTLKLKVHSHISIIKRLVYAEEIS